MNAYVDLGNNLELIVMNSLDPIGDRQFISRIRGKDSKQLLPRIEQFQADVFHEQGVQDYEDKIYRSKDIVGILDGSEKRYHQLYLFEADPNAKQRHQGEFVFGRIIGFLPTEDMTVEGIGRVILDYFPPLVLNADSQRTFPTEVSKFKTGMSGTAPLTPSQMLLGYERHIRKPNEIQARFNDGVGTNEGQQRINGYRVSDVPIYVISMSAENATDYQAQPADALRFWGAFLSGMQSRLTEQGANNLIVEKYLKGGYVDSDALKKLKLNADDLPFVRLTKQAIASDARANSGYVPFF